MSKNDKAIALVGLPDSGKTVLLTTLFQGPDWSIQELNRDTIYFLAEKKDEIKNGHWPAPTPDNQKAKELIFRVARNGSNASIILKSNDFGGEGWRNFIEKYCEFNGDKDIDEDDKDICEFLKSAAAVAVCVDFEKLFDGDLDQKWIVQAVLNFIENNKLSIPVAIVATKYDRIENFLIQKYDIPSYSNPRINALLNKEPLSSNPDIELKYLKSVENIIREEFGSGIWEKLGHGNVFFVAAIPEDTESYCVEEGKFAPLREARAIGIRRLETWFFSKAKNAVLRANLNKFLLPGGLVLGGIVVGSFFFPSAGLALVLGGVAMPCKKKITKFLKNKK